MRRIFSLMLLALPLLTVGCAGTLGTLGTQYTRRGEALVVDVRSYGFELRARPQDSGLNVGFRQTVYLYPEAASAAFATIPLSPGWHFGYLPSLPPAVKQITRSVGLEIGITPVLCGVEAGCTQRAFTSLPLGKSQALHIRYRSSAPGDSFIESLNFYATKKSKKI